MNSPARFAEFLYRWHGLDRPQAGEQPLRHAIDKLQSYVVPYSDLEAMLLPARIAGYQYGELDRLCQLGDLVWQGNERISSADGAISLYRVDAARRLARIAGLIPGERYIALRNLLAERPRDFEDIILSLGGFPPQVLAAVWGMVWAGEVSNRRLLPLQALQADKVNRKYTGRTRGGRGLAGRRRLDNPVGSVGEWYLLAGPGQGSASPAARDRALTEQLLQRWGVVAPQTFSFEGVVGGFKRFERVLGELSAAGEVVEGRFVDRFGNLQFASLEAIDLLYDRTDAGPRMLAATDPVNPYGAVLPWPAASAGRKGPQRVAAARVVLYGGDLIGYLSARGHNLMTFEPAATGAKADLVGALVDALIRSARPGLPVIIDTIDGRSPAGTTLGGVLRAAGFRTGRQGSLRFMR